MSVNRTIGPTLVKIFFSVPVTSRIVKPCIVIVLDLSFEHALWQSAIDLHFVCFCFDSGLTSR